MPKRLLLGVGILLFAGAAAGGAWLWVSQSKPKIQETRETGSIPASVLAGQNLSSKKCSGAGAGTLTHLPMNFADFAFILPYGLVIGGHVTPIDHQYYSPIIFNSPRDAYPVFAMANARLVDIQPRTTERGTEYRLVFSMTCTFLYYYDLVTSLAPDVRAAYEKGNVDLEVKSGQLIGRIGGQTLDFAVWDTTKPLAGFVNPESYRAEPWKIYTADPLEYATPGIKEKMLAKYIRVASPRSGKIDYDIDGRLIGNWFLEGSGGYNTGNGGEYWKGHLSIAPDYLDPTVFIVSFGDYRGQATQFSTPRSSPNPAEVSVVTGLVKYDLKTWQYLDGNGRQWDRFSFPSALPLTITNDFPSQGCVLFQLVQSRKLKMEVFPGKSCSAANSFDDAAKLYER